MKKLTETELENERKIEDALEQEQNANCNQIVSYNGLCPCCGVELFYNEIGDEGGIYTEQCPSCDWESDILYDL
jgi:DNA repair exonuclease SbcCD ATPase subunit